MAPVANAALLDGLTADEQRWLDSHPELRIGIPPQSPPFELLSSDGDYQGQSSDYVALVGERLGMHLNPVVLDSRQEVIEAVKRKEVALLSAVEPSTEHSEYLLFTEPYIDSPVVIITRSSAPFIAGLNGLGNMQVVVVKNGYSHKTLQRYHPELALLTVDQVDDGINAIVTGEAGAYVGNLAAASYAINSLGMTNLKLAAHTPYSFKLSMGVRKELAEFMPILRKALDSIPPAEQRKISERWVQLDVPHGNNLREVLLLGVPIVVALLIIFIILGRSNRRLHREIDERRQVEQRLRESEERLLDSQSIAHVGSWVWNTVNDTITWSRETYAIHDVTPREFSPSPANLLEYVHPDDREQVTGIFKKVFNSEQSEYDLQYRLLHSNGSISFVRSYGRVERDQSGKVLQIAGVIHDVTGQKEVEIALREKQQTLQSLLDNAPIGIWFQNCDGRLLFVNHYFCAAMGISEAEFLDASHYAELYDKETARSCMAADKVTMQSDGPVIRQEKLRFADGLQHDLEIIRSKIINDKGEVVGLIGLSMDITEKKRAEEKLRHQAYFDELTGLGKRNYLMEQLGRSLAQAKRHNYYNALLFFDLDNFKIINDSLGHHTGDQLLKEVGGRLLQAVRHEDILARLGGDEFVVILNELSPIQSHAAEEAHTIAEEINRALEVPYTLSGQEHQVTLSVGISMFPDGNSDANDILKHADTAMYRAKEAGRNTIRFFIPSMQVAAEERLRMQNLLRYAIPQDQLRVYFHPQYDHDGRLLGAECLLRWKHPQLGIISPAKFIPIAEDSGQIVDIGTWVLRESCKTLKEWQTTGKSDITLSVNVSPRQFHQPNFIDTVTDVIDETGIDPHRLELELTETILVEHIDDVTDKMQRLKDIGIRFAIDDFGTGYSSLAYLKRLPLDRLKIDQSFVRDVSDDPSDALIVETIIAMATHLELEVIAEGVETQHQLDFLLKRGCAMYQGYFFSRPLTKEQFDVYLKHSQNQLNYLH